MLAITDSFGAAAVGDSYLLGLLSGQKITASLVVSELGSTRDSEGGSKLLGGETDLLWLRTLRSRAELVITSGKTYRAESYRMPKRADLMVFSKSEITPPVVISNDQSFIPKVGDYESLAAEVLAAAQDYRFVHLEFGPSTLLPIARELGVGIWVSSLSRKGIETFCEANNLSARNHLQVEDLALSYCL